MVVKISLSIELEEYSTLSSSGEDYHCRVTAISNGVKQEHVYHDPVAALEAGWRVASEWKKTFFRLKNATLQNRKKTKLKLVT